jgi:hypothetical protein
MLFRRQLYRALAVAFEGDSSILEYTNTIKQIAPVAKNYGDELKMGDTVFRYKGQKLLSVESFNHKTDTSDVADKP